MPKQFSLPPSLPSTLAGALTGTVGGRDETNEGVTTVSSVHIRLPTARAGLATEPSREESTCLLNLVDTPGRADFSAEVRFHLCATQSGDDGHKLVLMLLLLFRCGLGCASLMA